MQVKIVLKKDQRSRQLTEGVVDKILTNSPIHHHCIKVRLEDGQFGRIKKIIKVDYPHGRAKEYYTNFISAKKSKIKFSLFHPSDSLSTAISP